MPVIKLTPKGPVFKDEDRKAMIAQLINELRTTTPDGPVIFEIPLPGGEKMDVLVVWEKWKQENIPAQTRSEMILEAYGNEQKTVALPLGVTYAEAMEQNLLPYAVTPMVRKNEVSVEELKNVMRKHGAFTLEGNKVDLRFPTIDFASDVHRQLVDELPKGYWSIVQSIGSVG